MFVEFTFPGILSRPIYAGVYKITFDGSMFYIGATSNLNFRFHKWKHLMTCGEFKNFKIRDVYESCRAVKMEIVEIVEELSTLNERETFYIQSFWGDPNLLNRAPSAKTNLGMKLTDDQVELMRERSGHPVGKFDSNGNMVERYDSIAEAVESNDISGDSLRRVFKFDGRMAKGFVYRKLDTSGLPIIPPKKQREPAKPRKRKEPISEIARANMRTAQAKLRLSDDYQLPKHAKSVQKYDTEGNLIKSYKSIGEAAKDHQSSNRNFRKGMNNKSRMYKGFVFKFL